MTRIWLVRHASHDLLGKRLAGRMDGVDLNAAGHEEARALAQRFVTAPLVAIYSSPMPRAVQTVAPLAALLGQQVIITEALNEIDFGDWTGLTFEELSTDGRWHEWNANRGSAVPPRGESMKDVQSRVLQSLDRLAHQHEGEELLMVTHGDVIRAVLLHHFGWPIDRIHEIEFGPAAVALLETGHARDEAFNLNGCEAAQIQVALTGFEPVSPP
jgi:broad specificity phosphatase PhoE